MRAIIELNGFVYKKDGYEGDTPTKIIDGLMQDQNLYCLCRMEPLYGENVSKLQKFVDKYSSGKLTFEDIKKLDIKLSIGTIKCVSLEY